MRHPKIDRFLHWFERDPRRYLYALLTVSVVLMLGGLLACSVARAADADLSWQHPVQYTDGSAIPAGALVRTTLQYGLCNATSTGLLATPAPVTIAVAYPANTRTITGLAGGKWCFAARSETASAQSVYTTYVSKDIVLVPMAPSGMTVAATTAFMAIRQEDRYVMVPVGEVPGGTACDENNGVVADGRAYFAVPTSAVTWFGVTQPTIALAACS